MSKFGNKSLRKELDTIFDEYPKVRFHTAFLVQAILRKLEVTPVEYRDAVATVETYIKKKAETGYLYLSKGKAGGLIRAKDFPKEEIAAMKAQAELSARGYAVKSKIMEGLNLQIEALIVERNRVEGTPAIDFVS